MNPIRRVSTMLAGGLAVALCAQFTAAAAPAPETAPQRGALTVSAKTLCTSFKTSRLTCQGGTARSGSSLVRYAISTPRMVGYQGVVVMRAKSSTCSSIKLKFFSPAEVIRTQVRIVTADGTTRAATQGNALGSISAKLSGKPFNITVKTKHNGLYPVYFKGSAYCTTKSGK